MLMVLSIDLLFLAVHLHGLMVLGWGTLPYILTRTILVMVRPLELIFLFQYGIWKMKAVRDR